MRRVLFALVALLAIAGLVFAPEPDPARMAALDSARLLERPPEMQSPLATPPSLADAILQSSVVRRDEEGRTRLALFGVRIGSETISTQDLKVHDLARRSLVRGLHEAAFRRGIELAIDGALVPTEAERARGANFVVGIAGDVLSLDFTAPGGEHFLARETGWQPPHKSALLPALIAILVVVGCRTTLLGLFAGLICAAVALRMQSGSSFAAAACLGTLEAITTRPWHELASTDTLRLALAVLASVATFAVVARNGGLDALATALGKLATGPRSAQIAAWLLGAVVSFDERVHTLFVGPVLLPVCDRFRVSREKLSYLVDATAVPLAAVSLASTWLAVQIPAYASQLSAAGEANTSGWELFVAMLPSRFYCLFTLLLAGAVALTGRDFGPMLSAERRARSRAETLAPQARTLIARDVPQARRFSGASPNLALGLVPLATAISVAAFVLARPISADRTYALLLASCAALGVALVLAAATRERALVTPVLRALSGSVRLMLALIFAWALAAASAELGLGRYLADVLGDEIAPATLPCSLFLVSAALSFALGDAWSTAALVLPMFVALAHGFGERIPEIGSLGLMSLAIAAVLEGAAFGAHASPLSTSTLLASAACGADHSDHVRTQLPYALAASFAALALGFFPCAFLGWSPWLALGAGAATLLMVLVVFGRKSAAPAG